VKLRSHDEKSKDEEFPLVIRANNTMRSEKTQMRLSDNFLQNLTTLAHCWDFRQIACWRAAIVARVRHADKYHQCEYHTYRMQRDCV